MTDSLENPYASIRDRLKFDPLASIKLMTLISALNSLEPVTIPLEDMISALKTLISFFTLSIVKGEAIPERTWITPEVIKEEPELISTELMGWRIEEKSSAPFKGEDPLKHQSEPGTKRGRSRKLIDSSALKYSLEMLYQEVDSIWQARFNMQARLSAKKIQEFDLLESLWMKKYTPTKDPIGPKAANRIVQKELDNSKTLNRVKNLEFIIGRYKNKVKKRSTKKSIKK